MRKRGQKVFIDRIVLTVTALFLRHFVLKLAALLDRIGQLAKTVGEFRAANINLKALRHPRIARAPGQGRKHGRVFVQDRGAADAEIGFDPLYQDPAEDVRPAIVFGKPDASVLRRACKSAAIRCLTREGGEYIDLGETGESLGDREPLRLGEWIDCAAAKVELAHLCDASRLAHDRDAIVYQHVIWLAGAVPFEQGEFGVMQRAPLAVAKRFSEFDDAPLAGRQ